MLSSLHVVHDVEAKLLGASIADALARSTFRRVRLDLGALSLARAIWALPLFDALIDRFPAAQTTVSVSGRGAALLHAHVEARRKPLGEIPAGGELLVVDASARWLRRARFTRGAHTARLVLPGTPPCDGPQVGARAYLARALAAGLSPSSAPPLLGISPRLRREARGLAQELGDGVFGGPLVALMPRAIPPASLQRVAVLLEQSMGARSIQIGGIPIPGARQLDTSRPELVAALFRTCAVCVGDDIGWAHVAAASGGSVVALCGAERKGRQPPGALALSPRTRSCPACKRVARRPCIACLDPVDVARVAERVAALAWPRDRIARILS